MTLKNSLRLRQEILKKIKSQVQLYLTEEPMDLRRYALAYKKDIERSKWTVTNGEELQKKIDRSDIVFGGDFHAFSQAQRVHLRFLREIVPHRRVWLCLECFPSQVQKHINSYLSGKISESDFLKRARWDQSWGFPWDHYKPLVDLVKQNGGRCIGLNLLFKKRSGKILRSRDIHAAKILKDVLQEKAAEDLVYVVYGDLHVAQGRLPTDVEKKTKGEFKSLTLYLNPEKIYFQLIKKGLDRSGTVLKFNSQQYCVVESPPWVKWQSYLLFLEESLDRSIDEEDRHFNYAETVSSLMKLMVADLGLDSSKMDLIEYVYSVNDEEFLDLLAERLDPKDFSMAEKIVAADVSFYWRKTGTAYLARGTVNYASHLAGLVVHAHLSCREKNFWALPQFFTQNIWMEAMAFFLSKTVNPHRKSLSLSDLKKQLAAFSPRDSGEEALKIALDQKMYELIANYGERPSKRRLRSRQSLSYLKAAQILGAILGEKLFLNYKAGRLSRSLVLEWLSAPVDQENFDTIYYQRVKALDRLELGEKHARF